MLNIQKLKNVVKKDGKIVAQCPACAAAGADATGNHLAVFPDGKYGCVANPDDQAHRKTIFKLVGQSSGAVSHELKIQRLDIGESRVLMKVGRLGRHLPSPAGIGDEKPPQQDATEVVKARPKCPSVETVEPPALGGITTEMARQFLAEP